MAVVLATSWDDRTAAEFTSASCGDNTGSASTSTPRESDARFGAPTVVDGGDAVLMEINVRSTVMPAKGDHS